MRYIADLHIHSHYSRATSPEMNIVSLTKWGQLKGIQVIGTGDFTHPAWLAEMRETLEEAEPGFFHLKKEKIKQIEPEIPLSCRSWMRFLLTVEISTIFSHNGKVRKIHSIIGAPSFEVANKINAQLAQRGNLQADGRPTLGLSCKELLKIVLEASPDCLFIPAHIWTPHFGVFGSKSGFNNLEECFEELTPYITALETGLSSDPAMSWQISQFNNITLISNSDAHSPAKLGREATRFDTELSYHELQKALQSGNPQHLIETIEFYPQEGKYFLDGHRSCGIAFTPEETLKHQGICPKCQRKLTIGVLHRTHELKDQETYNPNIKRPSFRYLVPLPEILAAIYKVGYQTKKVQNIYQSLLQKLGNEFDILLDIPIKEIQQASTPLIAKAIQHVREGKLSITPGYDGIYGKIEFLPESEYLAESQSESQPSLF